ncbi:MAG TPA: hypothetical protein VKV04_20595 [Verrucomicrobiae bacterium]|nr:hypothetical protein [Verrucomicrobiae bacterium]
MKTAMPATTNIIELRQLLAERFPGLRTRADELSATRHAVWPTGLPQVDALHGGLPKSALAEIVAERRGCGSALLMSALIHRALKENKFVAVIDGQDSLDVTQLSDDLSRLLWVRCHSTDEALKAADLLLRDGNLPLVLLDLADNTAIQLRKIPATTWYRFQRLIEQTSAICVVISPRVMVVPAQVRMTLRSRFSLKALEREPQQLLSELRMEVTETRRFGEERETEAGLA